MIVASGKILAIDSVQTDFTLSGDGAKIPVGLDGSLLAEIQRVSGKLDAETFETWTAQTETWDVTPYSGGHGVRVEDHEISVSGDYLTPSALDGYATEQWVLDRDYLVSGDLEPYAKTSWVSGEIDRKQDASEMSAYAESAWVADTFQPAGPYVDSAGLETALSGMAQSAWVDENYAKKSDIPETYSAGNEYVRIEGNAIYGYDWTTPLSEKLETSAFEAYSGWADDRYAEKSFVESAMDAESAARSSADSALREDVDALSGALDEKVDAVPGMGLSHNDYTDVDLEKLSSIETSAERDVIVSIEANGVPLSVDSGTRSVDIPLAIYSASPSVQIDGLMSWTDKKKLDEIGAWISDDYVIPGSDQV